MDRILQMRANEPSVERVVFSALFNESDGFLATYVENFLRHTGVGAFLVVNLAPGRSIACPIAEASDRVLVFSGEFSRAKYGHTLLNGHLEAFEAALAHFGQFDYFCSLASNSLFVRRFDRVAARAALERSDHSANVDLNDLPDVWWWSSFPKNPDLLPYMKTTWGLTRAIGNQIEGFFARADDWGLLHQRRAQIIEFGKKMVPNAAFPLEEILPATFICNFGSRRFVGLCHMFWDRPMNDSVKLDDMLGIADRFPAHVCLLKWFERSPTNLITAAAAKGVVGEMTASILASPEAERGIQRVLYRLIFEDLAQTLRRDEGFCSLLSTWRPAEDDQRPTSRHFDFDRMLDVRRELIPLPLRPETTFGQNSAHLFTEQTGARLHLRFSLIDAEQTVVTLSSALADTDGHDETMLQGFLYLACCLGPGHRIFRLRILSDDGNPAVQLADRIVLARDGRYSQQKPVPIVEHDGVRECYYTSEAISERAAEPGVEQSPEWSDVWIGLPFFGRSDFRVAIDVV